MASYERSSKWIYKSVFGGAGGVLIPLVSSQADMSTVFQMNETGAFIWEKLASTNRVEEIAKSLIAEFEVPAAGEKEVERDIGGYLQELCALGAVLPENN